METNTKQQFNLNLIKTTLKAMNQKTDNDNNCTKKIG